MPSVPSSHTTPIRRVRLVLSAVVVVAAVVLAGWSALQAATALRSALHSATAAGADDRSSADAGDDAIIPDGASISATDVDHPAIARLAPDLREALAGATSAAARDGIELRVTSGWRSRQHQQRLFDAAVARYGEQRAGQLVATPTRSAHVRGRAVDIGPTDAAYWMQEKGSTFGLCQVFGNEVWHYERRTDPSGTCPTPAQNASE